MQVRIIHIYCVEYHDKESSAVSWDTFSDVQHFTRMV